MELCPCGSGNNFSDCCEPVIAGTSAATTAEALMRARYTSYVKTNVEYIMKSTHPDKRKECDEKAILSWSKGSQWHKLEIVSTSEGGAQDSQGLVEFVAHFTENNSRKSLHEKASFTRIDGQWFYVDGEVAPTKPYVREEIKIARNDPCSCGSGKKYKKCCGVA